MKNHKINRLIILLVGLFPISLLSQNEQFYGIDMHKAGGNYYSYPWMGKTPPTQSEAPSGYEPYHIEHYGRHGSRWHIGDYNYDKSYELLHKAYKEGKLTPLGIRTYQVVDSIRTEFKRGRDGELSDKGAVQHFEIGERMAKNYPEIFTDSTYIDASSTIVIRCILSMLNGLEGIRSVVPGINVKTDASNADMYYMNYHNQKVHDIRKRENGLQENFNKKHKNKGEYFSKLFIDRTYAEKEIGDELFNPLVALLINTQSHEGQPWLIEDIFTPEEIVEWWQCRNVIMFLQSGESKLTDNYMPYRHANLLKNIIESADTAVYSPVKSVNLRYGHDTVLLPLAVLMDLNGFGKEINDLEQLFPLGWHDYKVIPMGGNLQIVFYRNSTNPKDVILKVLLNEEEATLPLTPVNGTDRYYKWTDFRDYYNSRLFGMPK